MAVYGITMIVGALKQVSDINIGSLLLDFLNSKTVSSGCGPHVEDDMGRHRMAWDRIYQAHEEPQ